MKKFVVTMLMAVIALMPMAARERVTRNVTDLPVAAQNMLKKHFPKKDVSHIKIDSNIFGKTDYDVILEDGTEVEFDKSGNWKEVDCGRNRVPDSLVPEAIRKYVKDNFKNNNTIVKIKSAKDKYEVELINDVDIEFDKAGKFLRYD